MFTGIIVEVGTVKEVARAGSSLRLGIASRKVASGLNVGDSVSVNGVCLTAVEAGTGGFTADVMPETYRKTNLKELVRGSRVNLEPSLRLGDPFGGHVVTGHIDAVCVVSRVTHEENAIVVSFDCPAEFLRYIVPKGSVAVDGVSLTVAERFEGGFSVSLIPHTARNTNLGLRGVGDRVNLEVDILGKYVESFLKAWQGRHSRESPAVGGITVDFLREHGF